MALDASDEVSDEALLVAFGNGDREAALLLTARLTPRVLGYASRMLRGDRAEAEDVTQEAMLRLWRIAPDWRQGEAKVTTWLFRVVTNLCTDRLRKRRGVDLDAVPEPEDDAPEVARRMMDADRAGEPRDRRRYGDQCRSGRKPDRTRQESTGPVVVRPARGVGI